MECHLDEASLRHDIETLPENTHRYAFTAYCLAQLLGNRFLQTKNRDDLDFAIHIARAGVKASVDNDHLQDGCLLNLGTRLLQRCIHVRGRRSINDINEAITTLRAALQAPVEGGVVLSIHAKALHALSTALQKRATDSISQDDMEESVRVCRQAVDVSSEKDRALMLHYLSRVLHDQYKVTSNIEQLLEGVELSRQLFSQAAPDDPRWDGIATILRKSLLQQFAITNRKEDLDEVVLYARRFLATDGKEKEPDVWAGLGDVLEMSYEKFGAMVDFDEAIECFKKAHQLRPDDSARRLKYDSSVFGRYEATLTPEHRAVAIEALKDSMIEVLDAEANRVYRMKALSFLLVDRFSSDGNVADLMEASRLVREAAETDVPGNGHSLLERGGWLLDMARLLAEEDSRRDRRQCFEEARSHMQRAVEMIPSGHPNARVAWKYLGNFLDHHFSMIQSNDDIEDNIHYIGQAIRASTDFGEAARYLNNLAGVLQKRSVRVGEVANLELAIMLTRRALRIVPNENPSLKGVLQRNLRTLVRSKESLPTPPSGSAHIHVPVHGSHDIVA